MKLNEILTISGHSGLFKMIAQGKNSIIVESLTDGKRMPAFSTDRLSSLSDIALFTTGEELPLSEVFKRMFEVFEQKEVSLNFKKQTKEMLEFFEKAIPEYDKERVYTSDIKKIMTRYNQLVKNNLLPFDEEVAKTEDAPMEKKEEVEAPKPKKTVKKKAEKNITE
ncbi:MAG TPA: DUF5606 domain-containing protein [Bacteroidales bacterium]|nr:DUF5606 domain-containing protein [Bacteroidales bacterium]